MENGSLGASTGRMMSLREIASWPPFSRDLVDQPEIVAGVPSLQRGLVWKAGQVELVWDSLAQGFPIGSLVVCPKLGNGAQLTRGIEDSEEWRVTHHLLDGQQRAQAIRLGYLDPFAGKLDAVLWLDLASKRTGGTRVFRFRVTTKAHPWGYASDDGASRLPVSKVRESMERCGFDPDDINFEKRPDPSDCWPIEAVAPVPLAWLLSTDDDNDDVLVATLQARCRAISTTKPHDQWTSDVVRFLGDKEKKAERQSVWAAVRRLRQTTIAVLDVPQSVLSDGVAAEGGNDTAVAIAETMFQRLNDGGTTLDGDELAYSMIKAHWPEMEARIEALANRRMLPEARLVLLAARIPMGVDRGAASRISSRVSVDAIRKLAALPSRDVNGETVSKNSGKDSPRQRFEKFFLHDGSSDLKRVLEQLDAWWATGADYDLPVVLRTTIARSSPDAYALLLWIAERALSAGGAKDPAIGRRVQALATCLAWFSVDLRKAAAAVAGVLETLGPITEVSFAGLLATVHEADGSLLRLPPLLSDLDRLLPVPGCNSGQLGFSKSLAGDSPLNDAAKRLSINRDMLLYAQRSLLKQKFPGYDPSRKDLWADHDRPWDFDHLLANKSVTYLSNINEVDKNVLWDWSKNSIANLRAWPFSQNRADGASMPSSKFGQDRLPKGMMAEDAMAFSFLEANEKDGFDEGYRFAREVRDPESLMKFAMSARARLLRIYHTWHGEQGLDVVYLTGPTPYLP